ncbi:hypothetical protein SAMN05444920_1011148 [Nonomuraea solani]|uniref:DUF4388 domain-containing protein n=1 Tax=Nonomuraea solani TaxID=1144553 RepID=A0A1H5WD71_9ACTN|nr:hypothetical protein [Nonomuraea solani]SEF97404.1 hypothetical protein SAMN05444920_1011148 [Nonomuraea solani]
MSPLGSILRNGRQAASSGRLKVEGSPGGQVYLRFGRVIAATTPASPGPESLLLRSGRVSEDDWNVAFSAGAPTGRVGPELVDRGSVGSAGLEVVCLMATFDALFAMALFGAGAGTMEPLGPGDLLPNLLVQPGIPIERLDRETARRLEIAAGWQEIGVTPQCRPAAARAAAESPIRPDALRQSVLAKANGRRTPRDIAFTLGQGLFVVMQEIADMAREGLVVTDPPPPSEDEPTLDDDSLRLPLLPRHNATASRPRGGEDPQE